jgi:two-component system, NtrC family, sensor histidine kinase HydH
MLRNLLPPASWPIVGLSLLLMIACLVGTVYINRLQTELSDLLRMDAARLQAAQQAQIHLREYRVHTILLAASPNEARYHQVAEDRHHFELSLKSLDELAADELDWEDLAELRTSWERYEAGLAKDMQPRAEFDSVEAFAAWADEHRIKSLLVPCGRLVERSQNRMAEVSTKSSEQTRWAGRLLLLIGLIGPLAGLIVGYTTARNLSRRVARLFVRVQAAQSQLDQEVGAVTLERPDSLANLDQQLGHVVDRVGQICRRLQEQDRELLRSEQLAAVGNLAAGIAHEIRNPLTGIKMMVEAAIRPVSPSSLSDTDLALIRDEIARLERTVQGLLDYAKPAILKRQPHDCRQILDRAVKIVSAQAERSGVSIEYKESADPLVVCLDPDQFISLMTNLLLNALDASLSGGRITLAADRTATDTIIVSVSDSGPGLSPEISATLFTPFATTKRAGTGLGLVVAKRIASDHGATLVAENRPAGGACFTVTIPAAEDIHAEAIGRR